MFYPHKMRKLSCLLALSLAVVLGLSACQSQEQKPAAGAKEDLTPITFALDWTANTNHSGLFLAQARGYYAEEGLDVNFQESDMNFIELVASEEAQFGIASQEQVLQARASVAKVPVVSIAAILQHNTSGFASPVEREIKSPKDFAGKVYSGWGTDLELAFINNLMAQEGADSSRVKVINQSADNFIASMETVADFAWIYWAWDGVNAELSDYPINFILLQDVVPELDFYSPTIISSENYLAEHPEIAKAFLRATKRGYEDCLKDPEAAVKALLEVAPELDPELVKASQAYINEQYIADASKWGEMSPERWQNFWQWMQDEDLLENEIEVEAAYDLSFLD